MNESRTSTNPYEAGLHRRPANYAPLTPLSFLSRAADVFPNRTAVIHGDLRYDYRTLYERCRRLASALSRRGIGVGDTVAVMAPNVPALLEAHFGVPMVGAVLNSLNIRLDAAAIAFMLRHGEAKALITDREFSPTIRAALDQLGGGKILVIDIDDPLAVGGELLGETTYEAFLAEGDSGFAWRVPEDEWEAIGLNYTSGTTGDPKGIVVHHRGAYLNAIGNVLVWNMAHHPVYLWTLPMFHCNGWCFPWTNALLAGANVCLRRVEAGTIFDAIRRHGVTHFCGAPVVLGMVINAKGHELEPGRTVQVMTAASAPPAAVLAAMQQKGFRVTHVYGLTEVYGPDVVCAWHEEWDALPLEEQARLKARQGVRYPVLEGLSVMDPETMTPVPADGRTIGEIMMRGNVVMKGYLKNPDATEAAFRGGWFHTGDLAVMHPDKYVEIKDRSKDIIISGGENISSIEVEDALYAHPAVLEAAVVARPDERWGESPCAFVTLKDGARATPEELIAWCRERMAHYKAPRTVVFGPLPKTSTGKVQKHVLREQARAL